MHWTAASRAAENLFRAATVERDSPCACFISSGGGIGLAGPGGRWRWRWCMAARMASAAVPAVTFQAFLGVDFPAMARNQVANLRDRRIRTVSYICEA